METNHKFKQAVRRKINRLDHKLAAAAAVVWGGERAAVISCTTGEAIIAVSQKAKELGFDYLAIEVSNEIDILKTLLQK